MRCARLATGLLLCAVACVPRAIVRRPPSAACGARPSHRVLAGETLYRIALRYRLSVEQLERENGGQDPGKLEPGQLLCIPAPAPTQEAPRASAPQPAVGTGVDSAAPTFHWPLRGVLYARFGKRGGEPHDGIDLAAPAGTPIHAAGEGKVLFAGEQKGYGLVVIIQHAPGWVTVYAHSREVEVREGDTVSPGTVVATVGESGHTTGPHLHFELRRQGLPVDPIPYLGAPPKAD